MTSNAVNDDLWLQVKKTFLADAFNNETVHLLELRDTYCVLW